MIQAVLPAAASSGIRQTKAHIASGFSVRKQPSTQLKRQSRAFSGEATAAVFLYYTGYFDTCKERKPWGIPFCGRFMKGEEKLSYAESIKNYKIGWKLRRNYSKIVYCAPNRFVFLC